MDKIENFEKIGDLINNLSFCTTREEVEAKFDDAGIKVLKERIDILNKVMHVEEAFSSPSKKNPSLEQEYEFELSAFFGWNMEIIGMGLSGQQKLKLVKKFKISEVELEKIESYFDKNIIPEITKNYLSHLKVSIEDLVNRKLTEEYIEKIKERTPSLVKRDGEVHQLLSKNYRLFSILLKDNKNLPVPARVNFIDGNALIYHNTNYDIKTMRAFIAHELGHVFFKKISCNEMKIDHEIFASIFGIIAMMDKNDFYKSKCHTLISEDEEKYFCELIEVLAP